MKPFWIYADNAASLSINSGARRDASTFNTPSQTTWNGVKLTVERNGVSDEAIVCFNENAEDLLDDYDSEKMFSDNKSIAQIYTSGNDKTLAINSFSSQTKEISLPIHLKTTESGEIKLSMQLNGKLSTGVKVNLEDAKEGKIYNLDQAKEFLTFKLGDATNNEIVEIKDRFVLHFASTTSINPTDKTEKCNIFSHGNTLLVNSVERIEKIEIFNLEGKMVFNKSVNATKFEETTGLRSGMFLVKVKTGKQEITKKIYLSE